MLWRWLIYKFGENVRFQEKFNEDDVKHTLVHQWRNGLCCQCTKAPEMHQKQFISKRGWDTIYTKSSNTCHKGYPECPCKYQAKQFTIDAVSVSTLLSVVRSIGGLNRIDNQCVKDLRSCCSTFFLTRESDLGEMFTTFVQNAISNFDVCGQNNLLKEGELTTTLEDIPSKHVSIHQ